MGGLGIKDVDVLAVVIQAIEIFLQTTLKRVEIFGMARDNLFDFNDIVIEASQMSGYKVEAPGDAVITFTRPFGLLCQSFVGFG